MLRAHGHTPEYNEPGEVGTDASCRAQLKAINLHFHDLRREAGSRWLDGGVPLHTIRDWSRAREPKSDVDIPRGHVCRPARRDARVRSAPVPFANLFQRATTWHHTEALRQTRTRTGRHRKPQESTEHERGKPFKQSVPGSIPGGPPRTLHSQLTRGHSGASRSVLERRRRPDVRDVLEDCCGAALITFTPAPRSRQF